MASIGKRVRDIIGDQFGAAIVEQTLEKAVREAKERAGAPQTTFYDPVSMFMGREWTEKKGALLPADLRRMAQNPIVGSIVLTRINQVAAFCSPRTSAYDAGFEISTEEGEDLATESMLTRWVANMGMEGYGEANLETFARKFMRDSLILDQGCAEIVSKRNGMPAYAVAVDAGLIQRLPASLDYATPPNSKDYHFCQVLDDQIQTYYTAHQMMLGVRNPQTDLRAAGYGMSELELLIRTVTTILNAEKYNSSQLNQGGTSKGVMVVKGDAPEESFQQFKRDFREAVRNAATVWTPPVLRISEGAEVDWVTLDRSNRDMEYSALFDFLVKQACGVYQIDPSEVNWNISGAAVNFESRSDMKAATSRQRGLKPLLTFLSNEINSNLLHRMDPRYRMEFTALEEDRALDAEIREREVQTVKTINEVRKDLGLPPIKGGDVILSKYSLIDGTSAEDKKANPKAVDISQDLYERTTGRNK